MYKTIPYFIVLCGLLSVVAQAMDDASASTATPAAALTTFSKALDTGDIATLATVISGDDREKAWAMAYASNLRAFAELKDALKSQFAKEYNDDDLSKDLREQIELARDGEFNRIVKHATLGKTDGDTVLVIFDEAASDDLQGKLVKADGKWMMDLSTLFNYFSVDDTPGLQARAEAATGLAKDISAGKYSTFDDATKAVGDRVDAAEAVGAKKPPLEGVAKSKPTMTRGAGQV